jgi:hypothetical protein
MRLHFVSNLPTRLSIFSGGVALKSTKSRIDTPTTKSPVRRYDTGEIVRIKVAELI